MSVQRYGFSVKQHQSGQICLRLCHVDGKKLTKITLFLKKVVYLRLSNFGTLKVAHYNDKDGDNWTETK
jgi:hypothetical protein